jgi:hypothetical protein
VHILGDGLEGLERKVQKWICASWMAIVCAGSLVFGILGHGRASIGG